MTQGRYFEDFEVGAVYRHWPGRTVSEADDTLFSLMTMNQNPLHIDEHYCSQLQHGKRLVNGTFVFSLTVGMSVADMSLRSIATLLYEDIQHAAPVWHGDTLYAESTVLEKHESKTKSDRGIVYIATRGINQKGETVLTYRRKILMPKKSFDEGKDFWPAAK
jgi:acyl dehydratase